LWGFESLKWGEGLDGETLFKGRASHSVNWGTYPGNNASRKKITLNQTEGPSKNGLGEKTV